MSGVPADQVPLPPSRGSLDYPAHQRTPSVSLGHGHPQSEYTNGGLGQVQEEAEAAPAEGEGGGVEGEVDVGQLLAELDQARADKENALAQYQSLLAKLTTMRNTLGDKLKQDAVSSLTASGGPFPTWLSQPIFSIGRLNSPTQQIS